MIEYKLSLASSGAVKAPGYEDMLRLLQVVERKKITLSYW